MSDNNRHGVARGSVSRGLEGRDPPPDKGSSVWLGSLGRRLVAGSAVVALVSVTILGALTLLLTDIDLANAGQEHEASSMNAVVSAVRVAHRNDPDWKPKDLSGVRELALAIGVGLSVRAGSQTLLSVPPPQAGGGSRTVSVTEGGHRIAVVRVAFPPAGLLPEEIAFRRSIERSVALAAGLALLVALGAAVLASRRLVAPVRSLTQATRQLAGGNKSARVGELRAAAELTELATSFDTMAETLQREDGIRRALVADLAHELRTPLAILQGQLEGLSLGLIPLDGAAVDSLSDEVIQLNRLIEDLRVLSEADAAGLSLERRRADLAQVASSAASRLSPLFVDKGVDLTLELSGAPVEADPRRLELVVANLLSNALKYTAVGGSVLLRVEGGNATCCIVVADTGRGIPEEEADRVFDRFFRGAGARDTPGSGIGLAVVSTVVAAHGGEVGLESVPGSGTTFTVRLPAAAPAPLAAAPH